MHNRETATILQRQGMRHEAAKDGRRVSSQGQEQPTAKLLSLQDIGCLEAGGGRVFLCDAWGGFFTLREQLVREVGGEFQADLFYRAGFAATERLVQTCLTQNFFAADEVGLRRCLGMLTAGGYGALDLVESRFQDGWAVVACRNTVESSMVRKNGGTPGFVCDFTRGLLRGVMHYLRHQSLGGDGMVECVEITCVANGDAECRFVIGSLADLSDRGYQPGSHEFVPVRETLLRLNRQLEDVLEAAQKDALTGLFNRTYFESALRRRVEFANRRTDTVAVAMIDVDRFKEVNDGQGHGMGDLALQQVARLLASQGRDTDVIARYGGDEFAVMMPGTSVEAAMIVAERIRHLVESQNVGGIPITLSIGVASCPSDATTLSSLIDLADAAMYRAKDTGGNGVRQHDWQESEAGRHTPVQGLASDQVVVTASPHRSAKRRRRTQS